MKTASLESRLAALAAVGETITYGQLAKDLGLRMADLTRKLEQLMEQDAASGTPFRAALLNARGTTLPARGFFDKAAELGADISAPESFVANHRRRLQGK